MPSPRFDVVIGLGFALVIGACSSGLASTESAETDLPEAESTGGSIRVVDVEEAAAIHAGRTDELVVLDVRTLEEFDAGHLDGAVMIDFYAEDFADQLAALDPDTPYLVYCRSGNRSGQTRAMMEDLGFIDVADVDGGIVAWNEAGLSLTIS